MKHTELMNNIRNSWSKLEQEHPEIYRQVFEKPLAQKIAKNGREMDKGLLADYLKSIRMVEHNHPRKRYLH